MNKLFTLITVAVLLPIITFGLTPKERRDVADHLQDISVTIRSENDYQKS